MIPLQPNHPELSAEELHQLAFRMETETRNLPRNRALKVSVPHAQIERFLSLLPTEVRSRVVVVPIGGFRTC